MSYVKGAWNVYCDVCGFKFKSTQVRKRWDNFMVCEKDWEPDHPQKYLRVTSDRQSVPFVRTEPSNPMVFLCNVYAIGAFADLAEADCAQADRVSPSYNILLQLKAG